MVKYPQLNTIPKNEDIKDKPRSITFDNGLAFVAHQRIAKALAIATYFAHPYV